MMMGYRAFPFLNFAFSLDTRVRPLRPLLFACVRAHALEADVAAHTTRAAPSHVGERFLSRRDAHHSGQLKVDKPRNDDADLVQAADTVKHFDHDCPSSRISGAEHLLRC